MLLFEKRIRKFIQESLLLEARYQLKNLLIFKETIIGESNLFDEVNNKFIENGGMQHDLNNPKSAGRFFIDVLFECMEELDDNLTNNPNKIDIPDWLDTVTNYILFLFSQKEVTSRSVLTGETFKDYILNFMNNYSKLSFPGTITIYEKLQYVYQRLNEKSIINNIDIILKSKETIKTRETLYPFGEQVVNGYLIVAPKTTRSSIFWARTNWLGEEIVLPNQDDISWCTARFKGGNMFNSYCLGGGMTLFYFLPMNDIAGTGKFCIGITKTKKILPQFEQEVYDEYYQKIENQNTIDDDQTSEDYKVYEYEHSQKFPEKWGYDLTIGGHTTVGFENKPIFGGDDTDQDLKDAKVRQKLNKALKIKDKNVLLNIIKEMEHRDFADPEKYVAMLDVEVFAAATNIDNLAPIDPETGARDELAMEQIGTQIQNVIKMYNSKLYRAKGYMPDEKILNYIEKNYLNYIKEGILGLPFIIPKTFQTNEEGISKYINILIDFLKNTKTLKSNYAFIDKGKSASIFDEIIKQINKLNITPSDDLIVDITALSFITESSSVNRDLYSQSSNVQDILNQLGFLEKCLAKHGITKNSEYSRFYKGVVYDKNFGQLSAALFNKKDELLNISNENLINLFFKTQIPLFCQYVDKEFFINNEKLVLQIAQFAKNEIYKDYLETDKFSSGTNCIFINPYEKNTMLPNELLLNKQLIIKLIEIDKANYCLLSRFSLPFIDDLDVLKFRLKDKLSGEINQVVENALYNKIQKNEIISVDYLNGLMKINPLSFEEICQTMRHFNNYRNFKYEDIASFYNENFYNILTFIVNFLTVDNINKIIFYKNKTEAVYDSKYSNITDNFIPYGENFNMLISSIRRPLAGIEIAERSNVKNVLFDRFKEIYTKLTNDINLATNILNFLKNQYVKFKSENDENLNLTLDAIFNHQVRNLVMNVEKPVKAHLRKLLGKNVVNDLGDHFFESKQNIKFKIGQKILTESQFRYLIRHLL